MREAMETAGLHALGYWGTGQMALRDFLSDRGEGFRYSHFRDTHYVYGALYGQVRYRSLSVLSEVYSIGVEEFLRIIEEVQTDPTAVMTVASDQAKLIPRAFFDYMPDVDPDGTPKPGKYEAGLRALIRAGFNPPIWEMEHRLKYIKSLLPGPLTQITAWDHIETE